MSQLIAEADEDCSGGINLQEFTKLMRKSGRFSIPSLGCHESLHRPTAGGAEAPLSDDGKNSSVARLQGWGDTLAEQLVNSGAAVSPPPP